MKLPVPQTFRQTIPGLPAVGTTTHAAPGRNPPGPAPGAAGISDSNAMTPSPLDVRLLARTALRALKARAERAIAGLPWYSIAVVGLSGVILGAVLSTLSRRR